MKNNIEIVLGSKSPRRQEILRMAGYRFRVETIDVDETYPVGLEPEKVPVYLAHKKALAYGVHPEEVLVTCDTVVIIDGEVIEKPNDFEQALGMLQKLNGREHNVVSGVCIRRAGMLKTISDTTIVKFAKLSESELVHYITTYKPYDKAGGYGVQEWLGMVGVEYIRGSFYNVMGLPIHRLYQELSNTRN